MYFYDSVNNELFSDLKTRYPNYNFPDYDSEYFQPPDGVHIVHHHVGYEHAFSDDVELIDGTYYFTKVDGVEIITNTLPKVIDDESITINNKTYYLNDNMDRLIASIGTVNLIDSNGEEVELNLEEVKALFKIELRKTNQLFLV